MWWPEWDDKNPDYPSLCPRIHTICMRMPARWDFGSITHTSGDQHDAVFSENDVSYGFYLGLFEEGGEMLQLAPTRNATLESIRDFLLDIDHVLRSMKARVEWFPDSIIDSGCLVNQYEQLGAPSPVDPITIGG
ncbi:MAG: hypothetical protein WAO83_10310 [Fuerstiella sp.]